MTLNPETGTPWSRDELTEAFGLVSNPANWKLPVDATVRSMHGTVDVDLIREAVIFFTGSVPSMKWTMKGLRVRAAGYYKTIGA